MPHNDPKKKLEYQRKWRLTEAGKASTQRYAERTAEQRRAQQREAERRYRATHREEANARAREYNRKRRAADPAAARASQRHWQEANWLKKLMQSARSHNGARRRPLACTITEAHLKELYQAQGGCCYWTHVPMVQTAHSPWTMSIDRLDIARGYEPGNVVLTSWFANRARNTMSVEEFRTVLAVVVALAKK